MNGVGYVGLPMLLCEALTAALPAQIGMHVHVLTPQQYVMSNRDQTEASFIKPNSNTANTECRRISCAKFSRLTIMAKTTALLSITAIFAACITEFAIPGECSAPVRRSNERIKPLFDHHRPSFFNCSQHFFNQTLDHFTFSQQGATKWPQKYYMYDGYRKTEVNNRKASPIFFYGESVSFKYWAVACLTKQRYRNIEACH